jgi:hypothetical protein
MKGLHEAATNKRWYAFCNQVNMTLAVSKYTCNTSDQLDIDIQIGRCYFFFQS